MNPSYKTLFNKIILTLNDHTENIKSVEFYGSDNNNYDQIIRLIFFFMDMTTYLQLVAKIKLQFYMDLTTQTRR